MSVEGYRGGADLDNRLKGVEVVVCESTGSSYEVCTGEGEGKN